MSSIETSKYEIRKIEDEMARLARNFEDLLSRARQSDGINVSIPGNEPKKLLEHMSIIKKKLQSMLKQMEQI